MEAIEQRAALAERGTAPGEVARYWRAGRYDGLECLAARFVSHRYAPHTHDTYAVGAILAGCETYRVRGERRYAVAGDLCIVHPGDAHDGEPLDASGYVYRMTYPSLGLMREIASELSGRRCTATPTFRAPVHDPESVRAFAGAHRALAGGSRLAGDERFVGVMAMILARHADVAPPDRLGREPGPVGRVRDYLDAHFAADTDLATLARIAGFSRFHLVRAFRRETGLTPHAWLTDRRVRAARALLASGLTPGETAAACGFADQSHLTRAFKARVGVPPGHFRRGQPVLAA